jgi:hypothetical protein
VGEAVWELLGFVVLVYIGYISVVVEVLVSGIAGGCGGIKFV